MYRVFVSINGHPLDKTVRDANLFCWFRHLERVSFFVPAESWDMFKRIAIILGSIILAGLVVGAVFLYVTGGSNPDTANKFMIQTAYLAKSKESYAQCYNSINHGTSLIGDVRLEIKGENFNDDSITSDLLDEIETSFMETVKLECQKTVDDYQYAYDSAVGYKSELEDSGNGLWSFFFGSAADESSTRDLSLLEPTRVRMMVAFNDYVFTEQQVKAYFVEKLGLSK
jgi:hypothetical protein